MNLKNSPSLYNFEFFLASKIHLRIHQQNFGSLYFLPMIYFKVCRN